MVSKLVVQALFGSSSIGYTMWTLQSQVIWLTLLAFSAVAAWFDMRERRIPNLWNILGLCVLLGLLIWFGEGTSALIAVSFTGILMLAPTLFGVWGQGDWKMAMVYGAALGVLPTLFIWWLAMLLAKVSSVLTRKLGIQWFKSSAKLGLPVAAFVLAAAIFVYAATLLV